MGISKNVFVSYSRRDEAVAQTLIGELSRHGFSASGGSESFKSDADWQKAVEEAIRSAEAVIVLIGNNSEPTKYQEFEWSCTLESYWADRTKLLIPVLIGDAKLPSFVARFQALRLPDAASGWSAVIRALQSQVVQPAPIVLKDTAKLRERLKSVEKFAHSIKKDDNVW